MKHLTFKKTILVLRRVVPALLLLFMPSLTECAWKNIQEFLTKHPDYSFIINQQDNIHQELSLKDLNFCNNINQKELWRKLFENIQNYLQAKRLQIQATSRLLDPPDLFKKIAQSHYNYHSDEAHIMFI